MFQADKTDRLETKRCGQQFQGSVSIRMGASYFSSTILMERQRVNGENVHIPMTGIGATLLLLKFISHFIEKSEAKTSVLEIIT